MPNFPKTYEKATNLGHFKFTKSFFNHLESIFLVERFFVGKVGFQRTQNKCLLCGVIRVRTLDKVGSYLLFTLGAKEHQVWKTQRSGVLMLHETMNAANVY